MLKHLPEKCPSCGSRVIDIHFGLKHVNGTIAEEITYECGCMMEFVPNFHPDGVQNIRQCQYLKQVQRYSAEIRVDVEANLPVGLAPALFFDGLRFIIDPIEQPEGIIGIPVNKGCICHDKLP